MISSNTRSTNINGRFAKNCTGGAGGAGGGDRPALTSDKKKSFTSVFRLHPHIKKKNYM